MSKPMIRIHDLANDELIDREMTDAEFAQYEQDQINAAQKLAEDEQKAEAKNALLQKLGISQEEANLLLS